MIAELAAVAAWAIATQIARRRLLGPPLRPELPPYSRLDDLAPDRPVPVGPPIVNRRRDVELDEDLAALWVARHGGAGASHVGLVLPAGVILEPNTSTVPPPPPPPPPDDLGRVYE